MIRLIEPVRTLAGSSYLDGDCPQTPAATSARRAACFLIPEQWTSNQNMYRSANCNCRFVANPLEVVIVLRLFPKLEGAVMFPPGFENCGVLKILNASARNSTR